MCIFHLYYIYFYTYYEDTFDVRSFNFDPDLIVNKWYKSIEKRGYFCRREFGRQKCVGASTTEDKTIGKKEKIKYVEIEKSSWEAKTKSKDDPTNNWAESDSDSNNIINSCWSKQFKTSSISRIEN